MCSLRQFLVLFVVVYQSVFGFGWFVFVFCNKKQAILLSPSLKTLMYIVLKQLVTFGFFRKQIFSRAYYIDSLFFSLLRGQRV